MTLLTSKLHEPLTTSNNTKEDKESQKISARSIQHIANEIQNNIKAVKEEEQKNGIRLDQSS